MRLLHTADWHLGKTFYDYSRDAEHEQFLAWLTHTIAEEAIDVLLIAGDVFDSANPPISAQQQLYRFLTQAKAQRPSLQVIMIAGNHDSPARLEMPLPFLTPLSMHVVGQPLWQADGSLDLSSLVLPLHQADGSIGAWCLAVPFLRRSDVKTRVDHSDTQDYAASVAELYHAAYAYAQQCQPHAPIIALGHGHVRGGVLSADSERDLIIGGLDSLPLSVFSTELAYVALGHLHKAQCLSEQPPIYYSGSPLPLSFSELNYQHRVLVVDIAEGQTTVKPVYIPRFVELIRLPEHHQPLATALAELNALQLATLPNEQQPYLQIRLQAEAGQRYTFVEAQLAAAIEKLPVRWVRAIDWAKTDNPDSLHLPTYASLADLQQLKPTDIFRRLYQHHHQQAPDSAIEQLFQQLLTELDLDGTLAP